jgi:DNA-binding transcriptional regulator YiaG
MNSMKTCTSCGGTTFEAGPTPAELLIGPRIFTANVASQTCTACDAVYFEGPEMVALELEAARWLAENGFVSGEEFRLLRKTAGLRAVDLAELLDVSAETVSHWETGKHPFDQGTRTTLAALVLDKLDGRTSTQARLRRMRVPPSATPVHLTVPMGQPLRA